MITDLNTTPPLFGMALEVKALRDRIEIRHKRAAAIKWLGTRWVNHPLNLAARVEVEPTWFDHHFSFYAEQDAKSHEMFLCPDREHNDEY